MSWKPKRFCPICGIEQSQSHRCTSRSLNMIDGQNKAAENNIERYGSARAPRRRTFPERLAEGFEMLSLNED